MSTTSYEFPVGALTYTVVTKKTLKDDDGAKLWGQCLQEKLEIQVVQQDPKRWHMTVLHELLHAISDELGEGLNEHQVRAVEHGLSRAAQACPEFFRNWIKEVQ